FVFKGYTDEVQGALVRPYFDENGKLVGPMSALLIEAPSGLVLVDAGVGAFGGDLDAGHLHDELEELGVRPWDIRSVVITHGHADHVGGLLGPHREPAFANARHLILRSEADFWASDAATELPDNAGEPALLALQALLGAELLDILGGEDDAVPGVRVILA